MNEFMPLNARVRTGSRSNLDGWITVGDPERTVPLSRLSVGELIEWVTAHWWKSKQCGMQLTIRIMTKDRATKLDSPLYLVVLNPEEGTSILSGTYTTVRDALLDLSRKIIVNQMNNTQEHGGD